MHPTHDPTHRPDEEVVARAHEFPRVRPAAAEFLESDPSKARRYAWGTICSEVTFAGVFVWVGLGSPAARVLGPVAAIGFIVSGFAWMLAYYALPRTARTWQEWELTWDLSRHLRVALRSAGLPPVLVHLRWLPLAAMVFAAVWWLFTAP